MANKNFIVKNGLEVGGQEVVSSSGVVTSAALGGQTLASTDSPTFNNLTLTNDIAVGGDINLTGDLNITGDVNSLSVTDLDVTDQTITLGAGQVESASGGSGIVVAGSNASLLWDETNTEWDLNNPLHITTAASTTAHFTAQETSGATTSLRAGGAVGYIGTDSNHPLRIIANNATKIYVATDGKIGIGSNHTNPLQTVDISGSAAGLNIQGGNNRIYFTNYRALEGATDGSLLQVGEGFTDITLQGNVGIGAVSPNSQLEILNSSTSGNTQLHIHNNKAADAAVLKLEGARTGSSNDCGQVLFANSGNIVARIDAESSGDEGQLRFFTSATGTGSSVVQAMHIDTGGNVGINENNPDQKFHVNSGTTNVVAKFESTDGIGAIMLADNSGTVELCASGNDFQVRNAGSSSKLTVVNSSGFVGVGTGNTSPSSMLHITGNSDNGDAYCQLIINDEDSDEGSRVPSIQFKGDGTNTTRMRGTPGGFYLSSSSSMNDDFIVKSDGLIGMGISPTTRLHMKGTGDMIRLESTNSGAGGAQIDMLHFSPSGANEDTMAAINMGGYYSGSASAYFGAIRCIATDLSARHGRLEFITRDDAAFPSHMTLTHTGDLLVGSSTNLDVLGGTPKIQVGDGSGHSSIQWYSGTGSVAGLYFGDGTSGNDRYSGYIEYRHNNDSLAFQVNKATAFRINSSAQAHLGEGASDTRLYIGSSGGGFGGNSSNWVRASGSTLMYNAAGGSHIWEIGGAQRLSISSTGVITQQTAGTSDSYDMILRSTDSGDPGLSITRDNVVGFGIAVRGATDDYADFQVNNGGQPGYTETGKLRIYSSGGVSIPGTALWSTGVGNTFGATGNHYMIRTSSSTGNETIIINNTQAGSVGVLQYRESAGVRGSYFVATSANGIYSTSSSDYRFKENVATITDDHLTKLTSLRPITYTHSADYDDDTSTVHTGFIAHEVEEIFPEFVEGEKDAVWTQGELDERGDPDTTNETAGDPKYQTVAYERKEWNVYIIRALQQLKAENDSLKARIEALEG